MVKFKAYFTHVGPVVIEAETADEARRKAAVVADRNKTFVTKVKRVRVS